MESSRSRRAAQPLLEPAEIAALYHWHSHKSTAVNDLLLELRKKLEAACGVGVLPKLWDDAVRQSRLSMWLHQALAFNEALDLFVRCTREARRARRRTASNAGHHGTALKVYRDMVDLGRWLDLGSDTHFQWECEVAPRHFVWRDAWAHCGGRLRDYSPDVFSYFEARGALEEVQGISYPLDSAWSEARLSFSKVVEMLLCAAQSTGHTS